MADATVTAQSGVAKPATKKDVVVVSSVSAAVIGQATSSAVGIKSSQSSAVVTHAGYIIVQDVGGGSAYFPDGW